MLRLQRTINFGSSLIILFLFYMKFYLKTRASTVGSSMPHIFIHLFLLIIVKTCCSV